MSKAALSIPSIGCLANGLKATGVKRSYACYFPESIPLAWIDWTDLRGVDQQLTCFTVQTEKSKNIGLAAERNCEKRRAARVILSDGSSSGDENGGSDKLHVCEVEGLKA
jgi:hypothetical protein